MDLSHLFAQSYEIKKTKQHNSVVVVQTHPWKIKAQEDFLKKEKWKLPGGLVVGILNFLCQGLGLAPGREAKIPQVTKLCSMGQIIILNLQR